MVVRKASRMESCWTRDVEEEREGAILGFTRRTFEQEEKQFPRPSGGTGTYVQSRILGGVLDPSSAFTPHIQPNNKSWWLDFKIQPTCRHVSLPLLLLSALSYPPLSLDDYRNFTTRSPPVSICSHPHPQVRPTSLLSTW